MLSFDIIEEPEKKFLKLSIDNPKEYRILSLIEKIIAKKYPTDISTDSKSLFIRVS